MDFTSVFAIPNQSIQPTHVPLQPIRKILLNYMQESERPEKTQVFMFYNKPFTIQQDIDLLLHHPEIILICDHCERNLNSASSVLLIIKPHERKDLCFTCFYNMKGLDPSWYYYVRSNLNVTLTDPKWNLLSELKLLNGLQKYGYGNWANIKNYLDYHASNFTEEQIAAHYKQFYLSNGVREPILHEYPLAVSEPNGLTAPQAKQEKAGERKAQKQEERIAGYSRKRQEHLFEYDPEAEAVVANLEFLQQDTPEEIELKYQLLEEYNRRILEREKRQKFVIEHRLLSQEHTRKLLAEGKIKRTVRQQIACFSRYMSFEESENIVTYLTLQKTLSGTIRQYMRQRRRFDDPTFEQAYQSMAAIRQKRNQQFYSGAPQLKVHQIGPFQGKRSMSAQPRLSCQQARKRLKLTSYYQDGMKITDISDRACGVQNRH